MTDGIPPQFNDKISSFVLETTVLGDCVWYEYVVSIFLATYLTLISIASKRQLIYLPANRHTACTGQKYKNNEDENLSGGNGKFDNFISSVLCTDINK